MHLIVEFGVVHVTVDVLPSSFDQGVRMQRDVGEDQTVRRKYTYAVNLLKPRRKVRLNREDIVITKDKALMTSKATNDVKRALVDNHVAEMINVIHRLYSIIPVLNQRLVVFLNRVEV